MAATGDVDLQISFWGHVRVLQNDHIQLALAAFTLFHLMQIYQLFFRSTVSRHFLLQPVAVVWS